MTLSLLHGRKTSMDPQISFVLAAVSCGLASTCVVLSLWSFVRLTRVEVNFASLDEKLPPRRIKELEAAFDAMTDSFEVHQQKSQEFKQSVGNSVQRLDQVMRRNEVAAARLIDGEGNLQEDSVPGTLPAEVAAVPDEAALGKQAALRLRYNRNRGI